MSNLFDEQCQRQRLDIARKLAGEHFERLASSPLSALESMRHPLPEVRAAATLCGHILWNCGSNQSFIDGLCEMAISDTEQPRMMAITILAIIFYRSKDRDTKRVLARVVQDTTAPSKIRNHAYRSLLKVESGVNLETSEEVATECRLVLAGKEVPLREIDWKLLIDLSND